MNNLKKCIKGRLYLPLNDETISLYNSNIDTLISICNDEFNYCGMESYSADYGDKEIIAIDFEIREKTFKECDFSYSRFKTAIKAMLGYKPIEILVAKTERM